MAGKNNVPEQLIKPIKLFTGVMKMVAGHGLGWAVSCEQAGTEAIHGGH